MFGDYKDYDLIEEKSIDVRLKGPKVPLAIKCQGQACYCDDRTRYESVAVAIVGGLQWYFFLFSVGFPLIFPYSPGLVVGAILLLYAKT